MDMDPAEDWATDVEEGADHAAILEPPLEGHIAGDPEEPSLDAVSGPCADECWGDFEVCQRDCTGCPSCRQVRERCLARCETADSDGDGRQDGSDNCPAVFNPDQLNCDGDADGDACDPLNASYVSGPEQTCLLDKDSHTAYFTVEHHVEWLDHDVSACGAPDVWHRRIRADEDCVPWATNEECCLKLAGSISATGASPALWCGGFFEDDHCH